MMTITMEPFDFESWHETHYEVVAAIATECAKDEPQGLVKEVLDEQGYGGRYELARDLTNEFETLNKDRQWDGEYFDEIELFLNQKLNKQ